MKRLKIISDVVTSRGIFPAGALVSLEDAEADSCIKNGRAELVSATVVPPAKPAAPVVPHPVAATGPNKKL
jgi:hypothetical protein